MDRDALNDLAETTIGAAIEVHRHLGPGLLERVYADALSIELKLRGLLTQRELSIPVNYKGHVFDGAYRLDMLVADELVIEVKAVETLLPVHSAQLLSYLKLSGNKLGLLLNFNVPILRDGVKRVANKL